MPRIGGAAVFFGLLAAAIGIAAADDAHGYAALILLACALPTFLCGLVEDLTKSVSVRSRLAASFLAPVLAMLLLDAQLTRLDTPLLDNLVAFAPVAVLFTAFAVSGVTNAVNIIDGLNGLASGTVALMLAGLGAVAWLHGDTLVLTLCACGVAAVAGFMVFNYPFGRIFLGDGGAYLLGFWVAECAVLLLMRNPKVSTWAPLLICLYPVWETVFSMYRRSLVRRTGSGQPDQAHLHHLVLRSLAPVEQTGKARRRQHALTSLLIWTLVLLCQVLAIVGSDVTAWLQTGVAVVVAAYLGIYALCQLSGRRPAIPLVRAELAKSADALGGTLR